MTILFDLDDTVCKTSKIWTKLTYWYFKSHGISRSRPKKLDTYRLEDSFILTKEQKEDYIKYMSLAMPYCTLPATPGAGGLIQTLAKTCEIKFITAREDSQYWATASWLMNILDFTAPIIFSRDLKEDIESGHIIPSQTVLIDNSVNRCLVAHQCGINSYLFSKNVIDGDVRATRKIIPVARSFNRVYKILTKSNLISH